MSAATCKERITEPGMFSSHTCGRKVKEGVENPDNLCGLHLAARNRHLAKGAAKREREAEAAKALAEFKERVSTAQEKSGLKLTARTAMPTTGPDSFITRATGDVIVSLSELEKLISRLGAPACDHSEMLTKTGMVCSCGKFVG